MFCLHVTIWLAVAFGQVAAPAQAALDEMVRTEQAFAKLAIEKGARDAFLAYFADEAVSLEGPQPRPAKTAIREAPSPPPGAQLLWEPRTGDIAASGELGYLTGPVTRVAPDGTRRHSSYMSVWKRQRDGTFKVVMDIGVTTPGPVAFAPGFARSWNESRFEAPARPGEARASLEQAERALAEAARSGSFAAAYMRHATADTRVHRIGMAPAVGRRDIEDWVASQPSVRAEVRHVEVAASGELGYTWGSYTTSSQAATTTEQGYYVRVWGRAHSGAWHILIDVAQALKPEA